MQCAGTQYDRRIMLTAFLQQVESWNEQREEGKWFGKY